MHASILQLSFTLRGLLAVALYTAWFGGVFSSRSFAQVHERMLSFADARAEDLTNFPNKGRSPYASLARGNDGSFYGTTATGGTTDRGTVFKMTAAGVLTTLVEFTGDEASNKGSFPQAGLVQGSDGSFYGTTAGGGTTGQGTVFKMTPAGVLTTLVEFTGNGASQKGAFPRAGLLQGSDGNFYGTTNRGGANDFGTVFMMTPGGVLTTLVAFTGNGTSNKGSQPYAVLVQGTDGNFYGTTFSGGANGAGTVFKMTPGGVLTTLVAFTGNGTSNKGSQPYAGLVQGSDGNFYGTTFGGGASDLGTVFKMTPGGVLTTLVALTGNGTSNKGSQPYAVLVQGTDGNFYGTTYGGGANDLGTVFKMTPGGVLTTLVAFTGNGTSNKGRNPEAGLVQGSDGNFYGPTYGGGANDLGTVFMMTPGGVLTTLVAFTGNGTSNKGSYPLAGLVQGSDGNFYGTTQLGGANEYGTVFMMTPGGVLTTLVAFTGNGTSNKGSYPSAGLVQGGDGNFYGTTHQGGANDYGTVFMMTPAGVLTTLVAFTGNGTSNKGRNPSAGLVKGSDGNFYGTTYLGGANGAGTIFKMTPAGVLTTLVAFTGNGTSNKGSGPSASLVQGSDGNFYGTTQLGGANSFGTVFMMTPGGVLTTLVAFTGNGASNKGSYPLAGLVQGSDGNFYGTTDLGGANDYGTVFMMTPGGMLTTLVAFTGNGISNKGSNPEAGLVLGSDGNFYGTTVTGGANDLGTVFMMTPAGVLTTLVAFVASENGHPTAELIRATDGNLYGTTSGAPGTIYRLLFPGAPLVDVADTSALGSVSAVLQAKVNARGATTSVSIEYGTDGINFPNIVPVTVNLTSYQSVLLARTLSGLILGTTYFYRFTATSSAGTTVSPVSSFSTLAEPVVAVVAASALATTSAQFNGMVNARNFDSVVVFEWGTDGNTFPNTAPAIPGTVSGNTAVPVSAVVAGLLNGATYYYRISATNVAGTTVSGTASFTTLTAPVVSGLDANPVQPSFATLLAAVDPKSFSTDVVFEYGPKNGGFPSIVMPTPANVTVNGLVQATVSGLVAATDYHFRVRATSAGGETESPVFNFSTPPAADATTGIPIPSLDSVKLNGTVNGRGLDTTVLFEYGLSNEGFPRTVGADQVAVNGNTPAGVTATVPVSAELPLGQGFHYRVRAQNSNGLALGNTVNFAMPANQQPVAGEVPVFFSGQVTFDPVAFCSDVDNGDGALLSLDANHFTASNAGKPAEPLGDGRRIVYRASADSPLLLDQLTYRVQDTHGGVSDPATVYLTNFVNYVGARQGVIVPLASDPRGGSAGVQLDSFGGLTGNFKWQGEGYSLRGGFPADGQFRQVFVKRDHPGVTLVLTLNLTPLRTALDKPKIIGVLQETTALDPVGVAADQFELKLVEGLATPGIRTGFIVPPSVAIDATHPPVGGDGFVIMTVGKSGKARLVGRLPDGQPFTTSLIPNGRAYGVSFDPYRKGRHGLLDGQLYAYDNAGDAAGTLSAQLHWVRNRNPKSPYYPNGIGDFQSPSVQLFIADGLSYPKLGKGDLDQLGLTAGPGNAVLSLAGGNLPSGSNYDVPLSITAGRAQAAGGAGGLGIDASKLKLKLDLPGAMFSGSFLHPVTHRTVKFSGALRLFDGAEPEFGRGNFLGQDQSGSLRLRPGP